MICPQTKVECRMFRCLHQKGCAFPPEPPPKPTMAEIERLVKNYGARCYNMGTSKEHIFVGPEDVDCAALLAAIRQLSNSTQESE